MKTLKTATIKKRLKALSLENQVFMRHHYIKTTLLQDRCPHEEEDYHQTGLEYWETATVYCKVCKKKLRDIDCSPNSTSKIYD